MTFTYPFFSYPTLPYPKVLSENSGFDVQDSIISLQEEHEKEGAAIGLDLVTGEECSGVQVEI